MTDVPATSAIARISPGSRWTRARSTLPRAHAEEPPRQRQPVRQDVEGHRFALHVGDAIGAGRHATRSSCRTTPRVEIARSAARIPGWKRNWCTGQSSTPRASARLNRASVAAASEASGFSTSTGMPASMASARSRRASRAACRRAGPRSGALESQPRGRSRPPADAGVCAARRSARSTSGSISATTRPPTCRMACACQRPISPAPTTPARSEVGVTLTSDGCFAQGAHVHAGQPLHLVAVELDAAARRGGVVRRGDDLQHVAAILARGGRERARANASSVRSKTYRVAIMPGSFGFRPVADAGCPSPPTPCRRRRSRRARAASYCGAAPP